MATVDQNIANNTRRFAKSAITAAMDVATNADQLVVKEIYVPKSPKAPEAWRAVLIDSFTQAGKTWKCFDVLSQKLASSQSNTLVLTITQANCIASANQIIQRARRSLSIIQPASIFRSSNLPDMPPSNKMMIVDFWNSRNTSSITEFVQNTAPFWQDIIIIIDEVDQGGQKGLKERLSFVRQIERASPDAIVKLIFVTATVANLSKSILQIANANLAKFKTGVVHSIIKDPVVEHQFADPHPTYVSASWFQKTDGVWQKLIFPRKDPNTDHDQIKENIVLENVKKLPDPAKELCLIVTSSRTNDHRSLSEKLYRIGFNVTVELNGINSKNYRVNYVDKSGNISHWDIPFRQIDALADRGELASYINWNRHRTETTIARKDDIALSHMLQAALFMATEAEQRIKTHSNPEEYVKVDVISMALQHKLEAALQRPEDYPQTPRVALIAGHLAGRGITIQNPQIDFTCTSFCFTDTRDALQRGATNTQRFGRACGMLADVFARPNRKPILVATPGIVQDAIANENVLREKAAEFANGTLISLKDMVSKADWDRTLRKTKEDIKYHKSGDTIDGVNPNDIRRFMNVKGLLVAKIVQHLYNHNKVTTLEALQGAINYDKSDLQFSSNIRNGQSLSSKYGRLWLVDGNVIILNPKIRDFIDTHIKSK